MTEALVASSTDVLIHLLRRRHELVAAKEKRDFHRAALGDAQADVEKAAQDVEMLEHALFDSGKSRVRAGVAQG